MHITYSGRTYDLPTEALGGTREAPAPRAVDAYLMEWFTEFNPQGPVAVYHDHFGVLSTVLAHNASLLPISDNVVHHRRRHHAYNVNGLDYSQPPMPALLQVNRAAVALMHVPKYPDLFEWYLRDFSRNVHPDTPLAAAFYTRHFTPKLLTIAERYADEVAQTKAVKKARLLVLSKWKGAKEERLPLNTWTYDGAKYVQYPGVFSANHLDYATQFLLEEWGNHDALRLPSVNHILDIGCGNGIIGTALSRKYYGRATVDGTDTSHVAVASARLNNGAGSYHWREDLALFENDRFDLIVTNPPFHDGHRNAIKPTLKLFAEAALKLAPGGRFVIVANRHLNYATHLRRMFTSVATVVENKKFIIYSSTSGS